MNVLARVSALGIRKTRSSEGAKGAKKKISSRSDQIEVDFPADFKHSGSNDVMAEFRLLTSLLRSFALS
jgi:hypothetical protein